MTDRFLVVLDSPVRAASDIRRTSDAVRDRLAGALDDEVAVGHDEQPAEVGEHHFDNEYWALSGAASFMSRDDPNADEDLEVSVQVHRSTETLVGSSDILAGDDIVSDGPRREVPIGTALVHWAPEAVEATRTGHRAETPRIVA